MDVPDVQIHTSHGLISLKDNLEEVNLGITKDGWVLVKTATKVSNVAGVQRDIVLNQVVKTILFAARSDGYRITGYINKRVGEESGPIGRDYDWEAITQVDAPVAISCYHLGGESDVTWIVEFDKGYRGNPRGHPVGEMISLEANGGDILIINAWVTRRVPRLLKQPPEEEAYIVVHYIWRGYSNRGKIDEGLGNNIMELSGTECERKGDYIEWVL